MGFLGAILGGFIGSSFGGPIGTIIGAIIGGVIGSQAASKKQQEQQTRFTAEELQRNFIVCLFGLMAHVARTDGHVTSDEASLINQYAKQNFPDRLDFIRQVIAESRQPGHGIDYYLTHYTAGWSNNYNIRRTLLDILCEIVMADGNIAQSEMQVLFYIEQHFNFYGHCLQYIRSHYQNGSNRDSSNQRQYQYEQRQSRQEYHSTAQNTNSLDEHYATLGIKAGASDKEIKNAYRKKCHEWHPDMLQSKGLPPELMKRAEQEMKKINAAYDAIKKTRGI